ncbi:MAG TPA: ABC transporter ATP-binding protein [Spirochaetia bacterium]|nr:ABC transporter ATP-binding protein [Spirochaetia bacterium]
MAAEDLLTVNGLKKYFPIEAGIFRKTVGWVKAVDDVSFTIRRGETLGLVGESGCGKSTTGRTVLRLIGQTAGEIWFEGRSISSLKGDELRFVRRNMQMIFQDPYASLDPRMNVEDTVSEPLIIHGMYPDKAERLKWVVEVLDSVGLESEHLKRYPHEFSGGQRQRIGIARALSIGPKLIVADEPVSALDVSIQAQVINLLKKLRIDFGLTYLFISHDLSVVRHISDRVAVMYLGKIIELAEKKELFSNPLHPYTEALLSAVPIPDPEKQTERIVLEGDVISPVNVPTGCAFHPRCVKAMEVCRETAPRYLEAGEDHFVSCHLHS